MDDTAYCREGSRNNALCETAIEGLEEIPALIKALPLEIQIHIFSRLPLSSLMQTNLVCRDWHSIGLEIRRPISCKGKRLTTWMLNRISKIHGSYLTINDCGIASPTKWIPIFLNSKRITYLELNICNGTTLSWAVHYGNIERVKSLPLIAKTVNQKTRDGDRPLHIAAKMGYRDIAELLINNGANIGAKDGNGDTAFIVAIEHGQQALVELLLNDNNINETNPDGYTPLQLAVKMGYRDIAELLINNGAQVNRVTKGGITALHLAAKHGHSDIIGLLLDKGANMYIRTNKRIPLQYAIKEGHKKSVAVFLDKSNIDVQGEYGRIMLYWAIKYKRTGIVLLLLSRGVNANEEFNGHTMLKWANKHGSREVAGLLKNRGCH